MHGSHDSIDDDYGRKGNVIRLAGITSDDTSMDTVMTELSQIYSS